MKIQPDILTILSESTTDGELLHLPGQLDRKTYAAVAKVIDAAGGKWITKRKAHVFAGLDAGERLEQILLTGEVTVPRDDFEFFPTPNNVVAKMIAEADIRDGMSVLEPSAGDGRLVRAAATGAVVTAVELNPNMISILCDPGMAQRVIAGDFLSITETSSLGKFDRVIMNPPFGRQRDIDHVTHALKFLKPGGRLVAVMAAGVMFRTNAKTLRFRELIEAEADCSITPLPPESFKSSGTSVNTCLVRVVKA